jgi:L-alanine-DL-glutamate epimerase-like enolase superfamily enzyme
MRIVAVETHHIAVPASIGAQAVGFAGTGWSRMNTLFLRLVTDQGLEGWGEGFGHASCPATRAVLDTQLGPALLGQDARDIAGLFRRMGQALHVYGRNGPHLHALSAMDVALWDIAGKAAGLPLWRLLGASPVESHRAYASLLRYGEARAIGANVERAVAQGYGHLKLHEIAYTPVAAARAAAGPGPRIMLDTNCPWTVDEALAMAARLRPLDLDWLEEPVWPPEDFAGLARVRREGGIPVAAGENAQGLMDFRGAFDAQALDVAQPSVAKIGGVTGMMAIAGLAEARGVRLIPHCAYFGPGFLASLHLHARLAPREPFERLFMDLEASPYHGAVDAVGGRVAVPQGPGLGLDPDMAVLARYAVSPPTVLRA